MAQDLAASRSLVGDAERDVPGRDVAARRLGVTALVVEEDVGAESLQKWALVEPAEEQRLVDADIPRAQGAHHAFVGGRAARSHQGSPDGRALGRMLGLDTMQRR